MKPLIGGSGGGGVSLENDPEFAKYFKMVKMGVPLASVQHKMRGAGLDPSVLEMDPASPSPNSSALVAADAGAGGAARRPPRSGGAVGRRAPRRAAPRRDSSPDSPR